MRMRGSLRDLQLTHSEGYGSEVSASTPMPDMRAEVSEGMALPMTKDDAKALRFIEVKLSEGDELGPYIADIELFDDGTIVIDWTGTQGPEWGWPVEDTVKVANAILALAKGEGHVSPASSSKR